MFWECLGYYVAGSLQPIEEMMRLPQYTEVLQRRVFQRWKIVISVVPGPFNRIITQLHIENDEKINEWEEHADTWLTLEFSAR